MLGKYSEYRQNWFLEAAGDLLLHLKFKWVTPRERTSMLFCITEPLMTGYRILESSFTVACAALFYWTENDKNELGQSMKPVFTANICFLKFMYKILDYLYYLGNRYRLNLQRILRRKQNTLNLTMFCLIRLVPNFGGWGLPGSFE